MKRKQLPAPRNPFVAPAKFRKAGPHQKSLKSLRRAAKMQLQREPGRVDEGTWLLTRRRTGSNPSVPTTNSYAWPLTPRPVREIIASGQPYEFDSTKRTGCAAGLSIRVSLVQAQVVEPVSVT